MPIKNAIHSQQVYDPTDESIMAEQELCMERLYAYNHTRPSEHAKREQLLKEMLAECGAGCWIEPPFHANRGGKHVHMGDYVYANFGLTCVDDPHIYIGEHTMIGPNCVLATATTQSCRNCVRKHISTICPSASVATAGWELA